MGGIQKALSDKCLIWQSLLPARSWSGRAAASEQPPLLKAWQAYVPGMSRALYTNLLLGCLWEPDMVEVVEAIASQWAMCQMGALRKDSLDSSSSHQALPCSI